MRLTDRMRRTPPTPRTLQASPRCGATWTCTPHSITAHLRMQTRDSQDCSAARTIRETPRRTAHRHHVRRPIVGGGTSRIHCLVTHISHPRSVCHTRSPRSLSHYAARWSAEGGTARPPSNIRSTAAPRAHDVHAATAHSVLAARPPVLPLTRSAAPPRRTVIFAGSATAPAACHTPSHRSAACAAGNK